MSSANPSTTTRLPLQPFQKLALNAPDYPAARASTTTSTVGSGHKQSLSRPPTGQPGSPRLATAAGSSSHRPSTSTASHLHQHTAQGLHGPAHATHLRVAAGSTLASVAQQAATRGLDRVDIGTYDGGFEADERKRESAAAAASGGGSQSSTKGESQQDAAHQPESASQITG